MGIPEEFDFACRAAHIGDYKGAAAKMRVIAEDAAKFYLKQWNLNKSYQDISNHPANEKKGNFCRMVYTIRKNTPFFQDDYKRKLLVFMELARPYGNDGSHPEKDVSAACANFLIEFYRDNIKKTLEKDYRQTQNTWNPENVTAKFIGKKITIYSLISYQYVTARVDLENAPIYCNAGEALDWEEFYAEDGGDGWLSLRAFNGKYLSVRIDMSESKTPVCATAPQAQNWEHFKIFRFGESYCIRSRCNGKWLTCRADIEETMPLLASRDKVELWETFDIQEI